MLATTPIQATVVAIVLLGLGGATVRAQAGGADLGKLDAIAGAGVRQDRAVGLVAAVVRGVDTLLMKAYGRAVVEWDVAMPVDAKIEVGSIAKQFTAAAKLDLDDEITKWLPDLGDGRTPGHAAPAAESHLRHFRLQREGDTGPVTELRRDDAGNHYILRKQ